MCYAEGMTRYLNARGIRIFDYPDFAKTLRERVRQTATALAAEAGVEIEHIGGRVAARRTWSRVCWRNGAKRLGLVHVMSAMEACDAYKPGTTSRATRPSSGRTAASACTTISTSWTPAGTVYLRVPTWAPFRLQFYCNGHNWLAPSCAPTALATPGRQRLRRLADWPAPRRWPKPRVGAVHATGSVCHAAVRSLEVFGQDYHWSLMQVEYATDLVFAPPPRFAAVRAAGSPVGAGREGAARRHLSRATSSRRSTGEFGSHFATRIEGTCIKHHMGQCSSKCTTSSASCCASRPRPTT